MLIRFLREELCELSFWLLEKFTRAAQIMMLMYHHHSNLSCVCFVDIVLRLFPSDGHSTSFSIIENLNVL